MNIKMRFLMGVLIGSTAFSAHGQDSKAITRLPAIQRTGNAGGPNSRALETPPPFTSDVGIGKYVLACVSANCIAVNRITGAAYHSEDYTTAGTLFSGGTPSWTGWLPLKMNGYGGTATLPQYDGVVYEVSASNVGNYAWFYAINSKTGAMYVTGYAHDKDWTGWVKYSAPTTAGATATLP